MMHSHNSQDIAQPCDSEDPSLSNADPNLHPTHGEVVSLSERGKDEDISSEGCDVSAQAFSQSGLRFSQMTTGLIIAGIMGFWGVVGSLYFALTFDDSFYRIGATIAATVFVCLILAVRERADKLPIAQLFLGCALCIFHLFAFWARTYGGHEKVSLSLVSTLLFVSLFLSFTLPLVFNLRVTFTIISWLTTALLSFAVLYKGIAISSSYFYLYFGILFFVNLFLLSKKEWRTGFALNILTAFFLGSYLLETSEIWQRTNVAFLVFASLFVLYAVTRKHSLFLCYVDGTRFISFVSLVFALPLILLFATVRLSDRLVSGTVPIALFFIAFWELSNAVYIAKRFQCSNARLFFQFLVPFSLWTYALIFVGGLSHLWFMLALGSLIFALTYFLSGLKLLRLFEYLFSAAALLGAIPETTYNGFTDLFGFSIPFNWFSVGGIVVLFLLVGRLHQYIDRKRESKENVDGGAYFDETAISIFHAGAASLLLVLLILNDFHGHPFLALILGGAGFILMVTGIVLCSTVEKVIGTLLVIGANGALYTRFLAGYAFSTHDAVLLYSLSIFFVISLFAAMTWERNLRQLVAERSFLQYFLRSLPSILLSVTLVSAFRSIFSTALVGAVECLIGALFLAIARLSSSTGMAVGATLLFVHGTTSYLTELRFFEVRENGFDASRFSLSLLLICYVVAERILVFRNEKLGRMQDVLLLLRTILVAMTGILGVLAIGQLAPQTFVSLGWLGLGIGLILLGILFRDVRYVWAGVFVSAVAGIRVLLKDFPALPLLYQVSLFGILGVLLIIAGLSFLRRRSVPHTRK